MKIIKLWLLTVLFATTSLAQITWTYSTRDPMTYTTGDTVTKYLKWKRIVDTTNGNPYRNLKGGTASGQGQAVLGSSTLGSGDRAGAYWDSVMQSDTCSWQIVWKQNEDSQYVSAGTAFFYFGMNDTNRARWKGLALKLWRWNPGTTNGGEYITSFRRVDTTFDQPTVGDAFIAAGGSFALRQNDTIRVVALGGNLWCYWARAGGGGTTLIDSTPFNALNSAYIPATGRMAFRLRMSNTPPMFNTLMFGTKSGSAPAGILRDTIPPVLYGETQSFSTDSSQSFTLSFGAYDSNTTTQKNPGDDSLIIKFGTSYNVGVGGAPDTVIGDSATIKAGTTKDTVISKLFSKKAIGTYYFQFKARDDTGNIKLGTRKTLIVGSAVQNPFKIGGYFYTQTLSSWWPAMSATPSLVGNYGSNVSNTYWFYINPDTATPYLRIRVPDSRSVFATQNSQSADSLRFFGIDRTGGSRGLSNSPMYQFRDSIHAHGNKIVLAISAVSDYGLPAKTFLSSIVQDTAKSKVFASCVANFNNFHKLDGIDFNWEFPTTTDKAFIFQFLKKMKDSLTAHSWDGQPPIISMGCEAITSVSGSQNMDISAVDSLANYMTIESSFRISGHGGVYTGNPNAIGRPTIGDTHGLPGDTVKGFDSYVRGDTTYQVVPQYVTSNGINAGGLRKSKAMQILSAGVEHWTGTSGPGQSVGGVGFSQLGESGGGSAMQNYQDNFFSFTRFWRDSTQNTYLAYRDGSNNKHLLNYDDSVSIGQEAYMLKTRGYSSFMFNEACWLLNNQGWRGSSDHTANNDRLSYLHWMAAAAASPTFTTVGEPSIVSPSNGSTSQGNVSGGTVSVIFKWNKVSNANEGYRIAVCSNPRFDVAVTGGDIDVGTTANDTTVTISGLAANTVHYWKVAGRMGHFYGYVSKVKSFTTTSAAIIPTVKPHKPILLLPTNAVTGQAQSVTIKWHQPSGFTDTVRSYIYQLGNDSVYGSPFRYDSIVSPGGVTLPDSQVVISGLSQGATYFWHVKSSNAVGDSGYSSSFRFSTSSASPSTRPSFKKTFRWWDDSLQAFRNDASPAMLMQNIPFSSLRPPRKADGTLDTGAAVISPNGIMKWDSSSYDFSKAGNYLLQLGNTWTAYQAFNGGATLTNLSVTGSVTTNLTPLNNGTNVGAESLGTFSNPYKNLSSNNINKVFLRNGNYISDSVVATTDWTWPFSGALLTEDFVFGGRSAISLAPGGVSVASVGQNRYSAYAVSASATGDNSTFQKATPTTQDSTEPGIMQMTPGTTGTLGTANGLVFSMKGDSVFGSINCRINGLVHRGKFYTPSAIDSLTIAMGLSAQSDSLGYVWCDSTKAGVAVYMGGRRANGANDTIWAYASQGTAGTTTKAYLANTVASRWYKFEIWQTNGAAYFKLWSDADNYTTPAMATIVTNLPANPTSTHLFMSAFTFDKNGTKTVKFGYDGLAILGVKR